MLPALKLEGVSVVVNEAKLLEDINLAINLGEVVAVVGANGAGKTTLLNAISGDVGLYSGKICLCGRNHSDFDLIERARILSVLPQFSLLNFPYSVDEVVALGRIPHSSGIQIDNEIVQQAMQAMDIGYLSGRPYTRLSGGEKQRTQLARVMAQIWRKDDAKQRVLLLDEPTTSLDLAHQKQLMEAVIQFAKDEVAVVMVVHDINIAATYADRILGLRCGKTICWGPTEEVVSEENLFALFATELTITSHPRSGRPVVIA